MCMSFGYNPQINFCHFFHSLNLVIFWAQLLLKLMDIRYLVSATPPTIFWAQLLLKLMDIRYLVSATPPTILSQSF